MQAEKTFNTGYDLLFQKNIFFAKCASTTVFLYASSEKSIFAQNLCFRRMSKGGMLALTH
jgi:hypothetical protein